MTQRGKFITLEGGEGTGKSTLIEGLSEWLDRRGVAHITTREPGGTALAEQLRALVLAPPGAPLSALTSALIMNAARRDHLERQIRPALEQGLWVLCDRFADSTLVYQSLQPNADMAHLRTLEAMVVGEDKPDLTLLLDGDPRALLGRRLARGGLDDIYERADMTFHDAVRSGFLDLAAAQPDRFEVIDAEANIEAVASSAWAAIQSRLELS